MATDYSEGVSIIEVARALELEYHQLDYWDRNDLLKPSLPSRSRRQGRMYSLADVVRCQIARELFAWGVAPIQMKKLLDFLKLQEHLLSSPTPNLICYFDGVDYHLEEGFDRVLAASECGRLFWAVRISRLLENLKNKLKASDSGQARLPLEQQQAI